MPDAIASTDWKKNTEMTHNPIIKCKAGGGDAVLISLKCIPESYKAYRNHLFSVRCNFTISRLHCVSACFHYCTTLQGSLQAKIILPVFLIDGYWYLFINGFVYSVCLVFFCLFVFLFFCFLLFFVLLFVCFLLLLLLLLLLLFFGGRGCLFVF